MVQNTERGMQTPEIKYIMSNDFPDSWEAFEANAGGQDGFAQRALGLAMTGPQNPSGWHSHKKTEFGCLLLRCNTHTSPINQDQVSTVWLCHERFSVV